MQMGEDKGEDKQKMGNSLQVFVLMQRVRPLR